MLTVLWLTSSAIGAPICVRKARLCECFPEFGKGTQWVADPF